MNATAASTILKEGTIISTRLGNSPAWYQNIVYSSEDNIVSVSLIEDYLENIIQIGSNLVIKYTTEFFEYIFEGVVQDIVPMRPSYVTVNIHRVQELVNTRVFPRYDTYLASSVKPSWDDTSYFSIVTNICLGGMAFVSKKEFDYGEECEITTYLPNQETITGKGKIIRKIAKSQIINYSMQFTDMSEENNNMLSHFLVELDENNSKLKNQFFNFVSARE